MHGGKRETIGVKSGTFTILTKAHVECLEHCARHCRSLIVVLNDDNYVIKKKAFCAVPAEERKRVLEGLRCVSEVIIYAGDNENEVLRSIRDDFDEEYYDIKLFHSENTRHKEEIPGIGIASSIEFCPQVESSSTSDIMDRISEAHINRIIRLWGFGGR